MVTSGANQAFVNVVLALCDASDRVVLFVPYYFNHIMALQMTGGAPQVGWGYQGRALLRASPGQLLHRLCRQCS
jgi:aspartate/methionine/tyrosine aminotransferase